MEKTKEEYFAKNQYTESMTTMDCEKFEKNLKRVFGKFDSNDWEYCHKCHRFGAKDCHKACGVMMKNLWRTGKISEVSTVTRPGRLVTAEESIGNASYAQSSQSAWDERVINENPSASTDARTLGGLSDDDEENM